MLIIVLAHKNIVVVGQEETIIGRECYNAEIVHKT